MTLYVQDADLTIHVGDALATLRQFPDESVDCVVTSPPYWGLRDYGTGEWTGGDEGCDHDTVAARAGRGGSGAPGKQTAGAFPSEFAAETCGKCGAQRVDQQLGLEPTRELFVERMVEVFREVRRVLARHGTCWVNLGDSYATSGGDDRSGSSDGEVGRGDRPAERRRAGLKPKDLVGIPWKVAQALQAPYYLGRLKNEADRAWLAGFVDGEGTISYVERNRGPDHSPTHDIRVFVTNTNDAVLQTFRDLFDAGRVYQHDGERENRYGSRACYRWQMGTHDSALLIRELYPYLRTKQKQAVLVWNLYTTLRHKRGHARTPADVLERRRHIADLVRRLNRGEDVDIPSWCEPPEGMWEAGWFLRSEIIWSKKPNPMPESVTDRPTKAHEQIFLLTKQPRYWFDQEAVREPHLEPWRSTGRVENRGTKDVDSGVSNGFGLSGQTPRLYNPAGRNVRSVWEIATQPYPEAHFATFPEELARRCILAGCPERVCRVCGKPSERITSVSYEKSPVHGKGSVVGRHYETGANNFDGAGLPRLNKVTETTGWSDCGHNAYRPGIVLDCFLGSGTVALVARNHGRHCIGIELSAEYAELAAKRTRQLSLLTEGTA